MHRANNWLCSQSVGIDMLLASLVPACCTCLALEAWKAKEPPGIQAWVAEMVNLTSERLLPGDEKLYKLLIKIRMPFLGSVA